MTTAVLSLPWRQVHLIGLGGVGMTGLALILAECGVAVRGSDEVDSANLGRLRRCGAECFVGHAAAHLASPDLVVYSSAIAPENPELAAARARCLPCLRRGDFLARLAEHFPIVVSVAGSHGKTTVTAMLTHVLLAAGLEPGYLIGGEPGSGIPPASAGARRILVTEVDESDSSQAAMRSTHAIVTNVDDDHCWSVGGEAALQACFQTFASRADHLVTGDEPLLRELFAHHPDGRFLAAADVDAVPRLPVPGRHNRYDAALALAVAEQLGVARATAAAAFATYAGVQRRLTLRHEAAGIRVIEDYAHHPAEVRATIAALREAYPGSRLRVVFQPHRYERVARYTAAFAVELAAADEVIVVEPFSAWLHDTGLADPRRIAAAITTVPARFSSEPYPTLAAELARTARSGDSIAVLGAGSVNRLVPELITVLTQATVQPEGARP